MFRPLGQPRGRYGGPGYLVMTPLKLAGGQWVLVNRGFAPIDRKADVAAGPAAPVAVEGLMRSTEGRTWFTPADDPAKGEWFTRDVEAMAAAMKLGPHAPFSVDADAGPDPLRPARRRRDDPLLPQQPPVLCLHVVRAGRGAARGVCGLGLYAWARHGFGLSSPDEAGSPMLAPTNPDAKAAMALNDMLPLPPRAARRPVELTAHGQHWTDDYAWIRADNWREVLADASTLPADIRALLEAENAYAEAMLHQTLDLQRKLKAEMRARIKEDDSEPPAPDGPWSYYSRFREGGQHRLVCRKPRDGGEEQVLLDGDALAAGKAFFDLGSTARSRDHRRLAWSFDDRGSEMYALRVRDTATGADLPDLVPNTTGEAIFTGDGGGFLYILQDENHRPWRVMLHRLGQPVDDDALIYEEKDHGWFLSLHATRLGRRAFISIHGHDATESLVVDLEAPEAPPRLLVPRRPGLRYHPMDHGDVFYIRDQQRRRARFPHRHHAGRGAARGELAQLLPAENGRLIEAASLFEHFLCLLTRGERRARLIVIDLRTGASHDVAFEAATYELHFDRSHEFSTSTMRFAYSTMATTSETTITTWRCVRARSSRSRWSRRVSTPPTMS